MHMVVGLLSEDSAVDAQTDFCSSTALNKVLEAVMSFHDKIHEHPRPTSLPTVDPIVDSTTALK